MVPNKPFEVSKVKVILQHKHEKMDMRKKSLLLLLVTLLLNACDSFEYHPYDGRITGETDINAKNIKLIKQQTEGKDTVRFVMMGDTQRWYDETEDFVSHLNKRKDIDFVIHGGDMSDFGATNEFLWMRDIMNSLNVPYVALLGNHDCLGDGETIYDKIFGEENFSFMAGNTKFVCLNTNALEYDYSHPVPDFAFMEKEIAHIEPGQERTILAMHVKPYAEQFNNNVAGIFKYYVKRFPNTQFCLNAHNHQIEVEDIYNDGIIYYGSDNIKDRNYLLFTLTPEGYNYEVVHY